MLQTYYAHSILEILGDDSSAFEEDAPANF